MTSNPPAPPRTPSKLKTLDDPRVARVIAALLAFFEAIDRYCRPAADGSTPFGGATRYVEEEVARRTIELLEAREALEASPCKIEDATDRAAVKNLEELAKRWIEFWGWGVWAFRTDRKAYVREQLDLFDATVTRPRMQAALDCLESEDFEVLQEVKPFADDARDRDLEPTGMDPAKAKAIFDEKMVAARDSTIYGGAGRPGFCDEPWSDWSKIVPFIDYLTKLVEAWRAMQAELRGIEAKIVRDIALDTAVKAARADQATQEDRPSVSGDAVGGVAGEQGEDGDRIVVSDAVADASAADTTDLTLRQEERKKELADTSPDYPASNPKQSRLVAHLNEDPAYITLDGKPYPTFDRAATFFLAELIELAPARKAFAEFVTEHPEFLGAHATRTKKKIPKQLLKYFDFNQGKASRFMPEWLQSPAP